MQLSVWLLLVDVFLWAMVYALHSVEFFESSLSPYELKRRADEGDKAAAELDEREKLLPRLETIRRIVEAIFMVLAISLTILTFGWVFGVILAAVLSLFVGTIARSPFVANLVDRIYQPYEKMLLQTVAGWNFLDIFRDVMHEPRDSRAASKAELMHIIQTSSNILSRDELLRFQASLALDSHNVRDIMTPVSVVDTVSLDEGLGPMVLDNLHKTGHSRFPVVDGDVHHVVGMLYLHDIINLKSAKAQVAEAMDKRVFYIHENQSLEHALHGFIRTHHHLFVVVNEFRETVGVLSLEDVLETLLGKKIVDEFDQFEDLRKVAESNPRKNNVPKGKTDI